MTTLDSAVSYMKMYPEFVFGTGYEKFSQELRTNWKNAKESGLTWNNAKDAFRDAFEATKADNDALIQQNGGFFKSMKKSLMSIFPDIKTGWKEAGEAAEAASKTKFWAQLKSVGKVLGERMPLIAALGTLIVEAPNIFKATKDEGLLTGVGETAKTAGRLGLSTVCGAITQALIPVPFLGGMIGFIAGDMLGRFIFGKSYTEKQAQKEKTEAAAQNIPQFDFNNIKMPYGGNTAFNDDEFLKLQQMYNQAANSSGLNSTNPFTPSMPYQMNPNNSSTF